MPKFKPIADRFWSKVRKTDACWEWTACKQSDGYGSLNVKGKIVTAHRFSWEMHFGKTPKGNCICHKCDNPGCVRPEHLFLASHKENMRDRERKGRGTSKSKTTEEDVKAIRRLYAQGDLSQEAIAALFNKSQCGISTIVLRKVWKDV